MIPLANSLRPRRSRAAFTLIELLTVIAIIGILAAIIIPVVGKVRTSAKRSQGISNLRQLVFAGLAYTQDNRGRWFTKVEPQEGFYSEVLANYAFKSGLTNRHEIFLDPLLPKPEGNHLHFAPIGIYFSDLMWEDAAKKHNNISASVKAPAKTVFFADNWSNSSGEDWEMPYISDTGVHGIWNYPSFVSATEGNKVPPATYGKTHGQIDLQRDPGQAKLGFFDGHVAIVKRENMKHSLFDPRYQ